MTTTYADSIILNVTGDNILTAGAGVSVRVNLTDSLTFATLFNADDDALSNPFNADVNGNYLFKVDDGTYDIIINEGQPSEYTIPGVVIKSSDDALDVADNITAMKATVYTLGAKVTCKRFYANGAFVPGLEFNVVAGSTGTDDGCTYHDLAGGLQAQLVTNGQIDIRVAGGVSGQNCDNAFNAITASGNAVLIPEGRFHLTRTDNRDNNATVVGTKMPTYRADLSQLEGGSIIVGTLELKGLNPTVRNLGVDHGITEFPTTQDDGLVLASQSPFTTSSLATVENVISLLAGVENPYHATLIEGHFDSNIDNVVGIRGFFGMAVKNTRNNLSNLIFIDNGSDSLIVKSDVSGGKVEEVNINNVVCKGAGTTGDDTTSFAIRLSAFDNDMENININNVIAEECAYVIYLSADAATSGEMIGVNINNVIGHTTGRGILIDGGVGTGLVDKVMINNVQFNDVDFRACEIKGNVGKVNVDNWYSSNVIGSAFIASTFHVLDSVELSVSNMKLLVDDSSASLGSLNLTNSHLNNQISGNNQFNLNGVGVPREGWSQDASTGTTINLTPVYSSKGKSLIEMTASGTRTVTGIARDMPAGTRFPYGYEVTIINNASGTVTFNHDPAAFVYNKGAANIAVAPNEIIVYKFFNSVFHQV